jgi:SynChlorMet cassette protein ScmD
MKDGEKPIANPYVVHREEFDDWAILFNPDSGHGFGLNPTGVYVWKLLDGEHSVDGMLKALRRDVADVPQGAGDHLVAFVEDLTQHGLARYGGASVCDDSRHLRPCPMGGATVTFTYEPPQLVNLSGERAAGCYHCGPGTSDTYCAPGACADNGDCYNGSGAGGWCNSNGSSANTECYIGNSTQGPCVDGGSAQWSNCLDGTTASYCHTGGNK